MLEILESRNLVTSSMYFLQGQPGKSRNGKLNLQTILKLPGLSEALLMVVVVSLLK